MAIVNQYEHRMSKETVDYNKEEDELEVSNKEQEEVVKDSD